jgi:serine protease
VINNVGVDNQSFTINVTDDVLTLQPGVGQSGSVSQGEWMFYKVVADANVSDVRIALTDMTRDVDLYVLIGSKPTSSDYDCRPYSSESASEYCDFVNSGENTYYIGVNGWQAGSYTITATLSEGSGGSSGILESDVPQLGSVAQGEWIQYQITSTASHDQLLAELTGLSDDVDLYVRQGAEPTSSSYDCRPYEGGTTSEICDMPNTSVTTWYISVHGYRAGSYTITATLFD